MLANLADLHVLHDLPQQGLLQKVCSGLYIPNPEGGHVLRKCMCG